MLQLLFSDRQVNNEIARIQQFIKKELNGAEKVAIGISGGLDCDVVARIAASVPEIKEVKLFTVIQHDMDPSHLKNARELAQELGHSLVEVPLEKEPFNIITALANADKNEVFHKEGLDAMRMKCNIRTCLLSSYQDHGFIILGTTNRTEFETGFFLPFGDGMAHIKPIVHLYKTQIRQLASKLGTRRAVLDQPASAGFWLGEEDLEDMAWWLFNEKPITGELTTTEEEGAYVKSIQDQLTVEKIDKVLLGIFQKMSVEEISREASIEKEMVEKFVKLTDASFYFKHRPTNRVLLQM